MKILIVEDTRVMALSLTRQLAGLGYTDTVVVGSAESALEALREQSFDAILLDWILPRMSGLELLKMLRGTRRYAAIPVLMTTSNDDRSDVIEAFQAGATDYMVKPYNATVLQEKLTLLEKKRVASR